MEVFFQKIIDTHQDAMVIFHKNSLQLHYCNKKALELWGNEDETVDIKSIFTQIEPEMCHSLFISKQLECSDPSKVSLRTNQGKTLSCTMELAQGDEDWLILQLHILPLLEGGQAPGNFNNYFNALQSLSKDFLYRLNIKTGTLYRNEATAKLYGIESVVEHYPNETKLNGVFHPDDMQGYFAFIHEVLKGVEGSFTARMIAPSGKFEYHCINFKALQNEDGSVEEMIGNAVNVHDLVETEGKLATINEYFNILQSLSKDLLYRLDIDKKILYRNEQTSKVYGVPTEVHNYPDMEGLKAVFHPDDLDDYITYITDVMAGHGGVHTARMVSPSGLHEYHRITFRAVQHSDGSIKEMVGTAENIQELMELETKASFDMLTKCWNKLSFQEEVGKILSQENPGEHALLFLDLDEFKYVNDNLGHAFGDLVIKELGKRLRENLSEGDFVGRVGGDEFVLFFQNVCSDDILLGRGKMLLRAIGEDICNSLHCHSMRGSIGIARYPQHGKTYEELYHHADIALYQSKNLGKNTATLYNPS